jgi:hypothetical protein
MQCSVCNLELGDVPIDIEQYNRDFPDYASDQPAPLCGACYHTLLHDKPTLQLAQFVRESNRIEGILRDPTIPELMEHARFQRLKQVDVYDLQRFVAVVQPGARLRSVEGLNVTVGYHTPPPGGEGVVAALQTMLLADYLTPAQRHWQYETLHPFTDGNGRSGRALWLRDMGGIANTPLGFMHSWYYQSLDQLRPPGPYERR